MFKCLVCEDTGIETEIISTDRGVKIREYFCSDCEYGQELYEQNQEEVKQNKKRIRRTINEIADGVSLKDKKEKVKTK